MPVARDALPPRQHRRIASQMPLPMADPDDDGFLVERRPRADRSRRASAPDPARAPPLQPLQPLQPQPVGRARRKDSVYSVSSVWSRASLDDLSSAAREDMADWLSRESGVSVRGNSRGAFASDLRDGVALCALARARGWLRDGAVAAAIAEVVAGGEPARLELTRSERRRFLRAFVDDACSGLRMTHELGDVRREHVDAGVLPFLVEFRDVVQEAQAAEAADSRNARDTDDEDGNDDIAEALDDRASAADAAARGRKAREWELESDEASARGEEQAAETPVSSGRRAMSDADYFHTALDEPFSGADSLDHDHDRDQDDQGPDSAEPRSARSSARSRAASTQSSASKRRQQRGARERHARRRAGSSAQQHLEQQHENLHHRHHRRDASGGSQQRRRLKQEVQTLLRHELGGAVRARAGSAQEEQVDEALSSLVGLVIFVTLMLLILAFLSDVVGLTDVGLAHMLGIRRHAQPRQDLSWYADIRRTW